MKEVWEVVYDYTCKITIILMTPHRLVQSDPLLQHADSQTRLNNVDELWGR